MKPFLRILFLYLLTLGASQAQLTLISTGNGKASGIDLHFKFRNYHLSRIVAGKSFLRQIQDSDYRLKLTLPGRGASVFVLSEVALLADDYVETVAQASGVTRTGRPSVKTFIGHQQDGPLTITATIDNEFFTASVHGDGQEWHIEQARNFTSCAHELLVIYDAAEVVENDSFQCGAEQARKQVQQVGASRLQGTAATGGCLQIRLAIAADALMFARYGSEDDVRNRILSTMNDVAQIYRQQFVNNIEFKIVTVYISRIYDQDPLSPNTTGGTGVLAAFRKWAYTENGFGIPHNMGQLWTPRGLGGGVAWGDLSTVNSGICTRNAYHVLTDEEGVDVKKRVTHEIGHNFGAGHDAEQNYSGYIMSPGYSPGIEWSDASRAAIDNYLSAATATDCLAGCPDSIITEFELKTAGACTGTAVQLRDRSVNGTSDRLWELEGGTPSTATGVAPLIRYDAAGVYDVKLTSHENSLLKTDYVFVSSRAKLTVTNCPLPAGDAGGGGIRMIGLNGTYIFPTQQDSIPKYVDRSCRYIIGLEAGRRYDFVAKIGSVATETTSTIREHLKIYIDYNNDGLFNETNELVVKSPGAQPTGLLMNEDGAKPWLNFTTPSTVIKNTFLRMRAISDDQVPANSCHIPRTGQVRDFAVLFRQQDPLPVELVYFKALRQENVARLEWETADEVNSDRFEVESSRDFRSWVSVGTIRSGSKSGHPVRYHLVDTTRHSGVVYYRLKMIDQDHAFTYSKVQSIAFDGKGLLVYPNPASDRISFTDIGGAAIPLSEIQEVSLTNPDGVIVLRQMSPFSSDGIRVGNLGTGIYLMKVTLTGGTQSIHKVIVN